MCTFPVELCSHAPLRFLVRFVGLVASGVTLYLCVNFADANFQHALMCANVLEAKAENSTVTLPGAGSGSSGTPALPGQGVFAVLDEDNAKLGCAFDQIARAVEMGIYAAVVGSVLALSCLTMFILFCTSWVSNASLDVEEKSAEARTKKQQALRRLILTIVGAVVVIVGGVATVIVLVFVQGYDLGWVFSDEDRKAQLHTGCNGREEYCDKRINELTWLTTHNAMSSTERLFVSPNHYTGFNVQLEAGVRSFMVSVWPGNNYGVNASYNVSLCHGSCGLGAYYWHEDLIRLRQYLDANQSTVVLIVVNGQFVPHSQIANSFIEAGLNDRMWSAYGLKSADGDFNWPTLTELIQHRKQIMLFTDHRPVNDTATATIPSWVHYRWDYMYATAFLVKKAEDFDCEIRRGFVGPADIGTLSTGDEMVMEKKLSILRHYITNPTASAANADLANDNAVMLRHYNNCTAEWGPKRRPNLFAVDFWSEKDTLLTVDGINMEQITTKDATNTAT